MKKITILFVLVVLCSFPSLVFAGDRGLLAGLGFGGGGGGVKLAYNFPTPKFDLALDVGYGVGTNYGITSLGLSAILPLNNFILGLGLGAATYSTDTTDIPGLSGIIDQGTKYGAGIFIGKEINKFQITIGYNSALGLTGGLLYKI